MITEQDYNNLSGDVYNIDVLKIDKKPFVVGDPVGDDKFLIIEPPVDAGNGMQAMAVAPIKGYDDENKPIPDTSHIVIAYAGTNRDDIRDLATDAYMIGMGDTVKFSVLDREGSTTYPAQSLTATMFAKQIEKDYPNSTITVTGHSLGGSLAMYIALKEGFSAVTFNGPDIHNMITKTEVEYMRKHKTQFKNYRNTYDAIGNIAGDKTQTAIYPLVKNVAGDAVADHMLDQWRFDKYGRLIDADGQVVSKFTDAPLVDTRLAMQWWKQQKESLSTGGLSRSEEIFSDSEQARAVSAGIASVAEAGQIVITAHGDEQVRQAEDLWNTIDFHAYPALGYWEAVALFANHGVTRETIVGDVEQTMAGYQQKAQVITDQFTQLDDQVAQVVQTMLEADKKLAGDFEIWKQI